MQLLLDTHTLIWSLVSPDRLSHKARRRIESPRDELFVSGATAWEISTKYRLGRLPEATSVVFGFEGHLDNLGATPLPVTIEHGLLAGGLEGDHADPFDRMLAAQAMAERLQIVTNDPALAALGAAIIW